MRLKLNLSRPDGSSADLQVTVDADTTVGHLVDRIARSDPHTTAPVGSTLVMGSSAGPVTLDRRAAVIESGLRSGTSIALGAAQRSSRSDVAAATLTVHSGPDAGRTFDLVAGSNSVGRGRQSQVRLSDPMVSTAHARIVVTDTVEIIDENSANGILLGGAQVSRVELAAGEQVLLGDTWLSVRPNLGTEGGPERGATVEFNRSPRVDPTYEGVKLVAPEPPTLQRKQRFPMVALVMPLLLAAVLLVIMDNPYAFAFLALSPLMILGTWWEGRRSAKAEFEEEVEGFRSNLTDLLARGNGALDEERRRRCIEHPGTADVVEAIRARTPLLWTRRPEHERFAQLRLGLGTEPSRVEIDVTPSRKSPPELVHELESVTSQFATIDRVPLVADLDSAGSIGVGGPDEATRSVARGLLVQLAGLHAPSELVVCAVASLTTAPAWEWLKWLPHTSSDHSPIEGPHLASSVPACATLVAQLIDVVDSRRSEERSPEQRALPLVVILVEDDAPIERNRVVQLAEQGPAVGVHVIWRASTSVQVPAACRSFIDIDAREGDGTIGRVVEGRSSRPVLLEPLPLGDADALARSLSPLVDSGALVEDQSDLPSTVSFLADAGPELAESARAVLDRWRESLSVFPSAEYPDGAPRPASKRPNTLRGLVGRGKGDNVYLDLRTQGPHALVGGTTGSGKSEFLQSWIMGMATAHGPQRVNFLFVDYKGGAAFADCVDLPHCVGLVTDLSPRLVRRALTSLRAELRHREHLLNRHGAKDLAELEAAGHPETPPSLVIVVDEFAALVQEVPEFVDGVVDVAQRGRSLGLHLILATQRPAGVIKDNLRANTNLRIALRVNDEEDSRDVIGTTVAATFDPAIPGRGVAKSGPGRLTPFQAGYVGGWSSREAAEPSISIETFGFAAPQPWELPDDPAAAREPAAEGPNDIKRLAQRIGEAATLAGLPDARRPWLPELSPVYDLGALQLPRRDTALAFGVVDDPDAQEQHVVSFQPDLDGNMAVYGTGGSGKSTFLRTLAVSAGLTVRGGPCVVYGMDFGARGLTMLESLPHVGSIIGGDDHERIGRLIRQLRETVDERAARYAAVQAGSIVDYRQVAGEPNEPRILVLVDGMGAFRSAYEGSEFNQLFEMFQSVATDGRQVGVHVLLSADRVGAVPMALASSIQRSLVLRLASENDLMTLGVPADGFGRTSPPGRGYLDDAEVQVAVLGGSRSVAEQAAAVNRLAARLERESVVVAPGIRRLPEQVPLGSLPAVVGDASLPVFGVEDEQLGPVGFDPSIPILIAGPPGSGRSTAAATLVRSLQRATPEVTTILLAQRRSGLAGLELWSRSASGVDAVESLAGELVSALEADTLDASHVIVVEGIGEFLNTSADYVLADLVKLARSNGLTVIAEGETSTLGGSWPLLSGVKGARQGLILQPDQMDGDSLFQTSLGRVKRADFPPGRGMYVRAGRSSRVQVAVG